ncbi:MAG: DUF3332 domain-containing protein [Leptospiraceae bacterium]|nr:DUF3332 domain-containing protein [Leptospiraceae bacterium]MDW7976964.1 DUF3332 family protein [Leptospiraceae bacterium]
MKTMRKIVVLFTLLGFLSYLSLNCYGSFPLVRTVYSFNGSIGGPSKAGGVIRSIVMILFVIIPVYGVSSFIDVVVLNTIEFWTGKKINISKIPENPILEIEEQNDMLVIKDKQNQITFYAFRNQPGVIFYKNKNEFRPVSYEIKENVIYLKDQEKVLLKKTLSPQEKSYLNTF